MFGQEMYLQGNYLPVNYDKLEDSEKDKFVTYNETSNKIIKEARENLRKAQIHNKKLYDRETRQYNFKVGDHVYRRNFKLSNATQKYSSKLGEQFIHAEIIKDLGSNVYILKDFESGKEGKYHSNDIKPGIKFLNPDRR